MPARILVIEDNAANLELMLYLLNAFGHTTISASDGEAGIQAALLEAPDLILCDIQIPKVDGYEVASRLRADPRTRGIPKIAVTAFAMVGDRDKLLAAGFDSYIGKPIDPRTFVNQLDSFLPKGRGAHTPSPCQEQAAEAVSIPANDRGTILLVDDAPDNLDFGRAVLELAGFKIVTVSNPSEATAIALRVKPCLVVSDVDMPNEEGYGLISSFKNNPALEPVPFVLISSTSRVLNHQSRTRSEHLGCAKFLVRPIEPRAFLREIEEVLRVMTSLAPLE